MNFSLRLCSLVLLVFSYTLQVKAVAYTDEEIQSIATKIEQGNKLDEDEIRKLNTLNKTYPGLLTENMFKQLRSSGRLRTSQNGSSKRGAVARRTNTARKLRNLLAENNQSNESNLASLVGELAENLEQAHYKNFDLLVEESLNQITTVHGTLSASPNFADDTASALKIALEYGIVAVVNFLITHETEVTQTTIDYLEQVQSETESEENDIDYAWFKSGADFEACRELLEAALTS